MGPIARRLRSIAEDTDPEWATSATSPAGSGSGSAQPIARRPRLTLTKPMRPGPAQLHPGGFGNGGKPATKRGRAGVAVGPGRAARPLQAD